MCNGVFFSFSTYAAISSVFVSSSISAIFRTLAERPTLKRFFLPRFSFFPSDGHGLFCTGLSSDPFLFFADSSLQAAGSLV